MIPRISSSWLAARALLNNEIDSRNLHSASFNNNEASTLLNDVIDITASVAQMSSTYIPPDPSPIRNIRSITEQNPLTFIAKKGKHKVGDCLVDHYSANENQTYTHRVINRCKKEEVNAFILAECALEQKDVIFNLAPSAERFFLTNQNEDCDYPVITLPRYDGARTLGPYLHEQYLRNNNGTITHKIKNKNTSKKTAGFIKEGCSLNSNELVKFSLRPRARKFILTKDTNECQKPIIEGTPMKTYQDQYCPRKKRVPDTPIAAKIIAGRDMSPQEGKHIVLIDNQDTNTLCTGTVLSDNYILTAAHCLKRHSKDKRVSYLDKISVKYDAYSTKRTQSIPSHKHHVIAGYIPDCYFMNQARFTNCDLALLKLKHPIADTTPMPLIQEADLCDFAKTLDSVLKSNTRFPINLNGAYNKKAEVWQSGNAYVQGYGNQMDANGKLIAAKTLHQGGIVVKHFEGSNGDLSITGPIVTVKTQQNSNICYGDSGGPLLHKMQNGKMVQFGISSATHAGCAGDSYFANLINQTNKDWIQNSMQEDASLVKIASGDETRLRFSPESCVKKTDHLDGFFAIFTRNRKMTFTNHCYGKNHPSSVNVKFYTKDQASNQTQLKHIDELEGAKQIEKLNLGESKAFYTRGTAMIPALAWSDIDAKIGIKQIANEEV